MLLEDKKIKTIAKAYNVTEDVVRSILDAYMALSLYNIITYKNDMTMFGEMSLDYENKMLKIIENSDYIDNIFSGNVSSEIFDRFLTLGNTKI